MTVPTNPPRAGNNWENGGGAGEAYVCALIALKDKYLEA